jgi:hypothetical protein
MVSIDTASRQVRGAQPGHHDSASCQKFGRTSQHHLNLISSTDLGGDSEARSPQRVARRLPGGGHVITSIDARRRWARRCPRSALHRYTDCASRCYQRRLAIWKRTKRFCPSCGGRLSAVIPRFRDFFVEPDLHRERTSTICGATVKQVDLRAGSYRIPMAVVRHTLSSWLSEGNPEQHFENERRFTPMLARYS